MNWTEIENLRIPQTAALEKIEKYIDKEEKRACLIHMPTGSGKSGIISVMANLMFDDCILIVTPRVALTNQISNSVSQKFFKEVLEIEENPKKKIFGPLDSKMQLDEEEDYSNHIFFDTIHGVHWIRNNKPELYNQLIKHVKLIVFDEAHYEPAYSWSQTIRNIGAKKILFTATPFRNDLKPFDISPNDIYAFQYKDGVDQKILRSIKFKNYPSIKNDDLFLKNTFNYYNEIFGEFTEASPKLIIRCSNRISLKRLANKIKTDYPKIKYVAIHEKFNKKENSNFSKSVPNPLQSEARVWLHQNKLLEGIDDDQFKMLAIYDGFNNDRALIQQIGRIVRVSKKDEDYQAHVIDFHSNKHENIWNKYLKFDKSLSKKSFIPMSDKVINRLFKIGEEIEYLLDGLKEKFDFESDSIPDKIKLPKRANFIEKLPNFNFDFLIEFLQERLEKDDRRFKERLFNINGRNVYVFLTLNVSYSPYLEGQYSLNIGNDLICFLEIEHTLVYFDSTGFVPIGEEDLGLGRIADTNVFKKLFNLSEDSVLSNVSLQNSNLGTNSIRSHRLSANSIDDTVSFLDDRSHIVTTASGKHQEEVTVLVEDENEIKETTVSKTISRYSGMTTGRISERGDWILIEEYVSWVESIFEIMFVSPIKPKDTFERYSQNITKVENPIPKHILLDLGEVMDDYLFANDQENDGEKIEKGSPLHFQDLCSIVEPHPTKKETFQFEVKLGEKFKYKLDLIFNKERNNYSITGDDFDQLFEEKSSAQYKFLTRFLNSRQSFKIIPEEPNIIYAYGNFYKAYSNYGDEFDENKFYLKDILIPLEDMEIVTSEKGKGTTRNNETWEKGSIFGLIDNPDEGSENFQNLLKESDFMVYDDMNTEIADVIIGNKDKVILIHVKHNGGTKYSASALQEVASQATKNIRYLNSFNQLPPPNYNRWDGPWKSNYGKTKLEVNKRIRKPDDLDGEAIWNSMQNVLLNPNKDREVWIMLGQTLSKKRLIEELKNGTYEAIQATLILHSCIQSIGTVNAKLKIFCSA